MPDISKDLILLLQYLLPGFLVAWVYYGLTSQPKPSQFERVVQALIFAIAVKISVIFTQWICLAIGKKYLFGQWTENTDLFTSVLNALLLGILFSTLSIRDTVHKKMRAWQMSKRSGNPSEWYGALDKYPRYLVLHLKDDRRLFGWPHLWPSEPEKGHFFMTNISWITIDENGENNLTELTALDGILINTNDVKWIEFLTDNMETENGNE